MTTTTELHTRAVHLRADAFDSEARTVSGIAVPWDTPAEIRDWFGDYTETFERGSVSVPDSGRVLLYWRHSEPIGIVTEHRDDAEGWHITARISETPRGDEAYALLRDGVITEFSIGFEPVEHRTDDATGAVTRTRVLAREVSLVPFGAFGSDAPVTEVRGASLIDAPERDTMTTNTAATSFDPADLAEVRERMDEIERRAATFAVRDETPVADTRSAGEILKAIAAGDDSTIRAYEAAIAERAYTGGTTADTVVKPQGLIDLVRIFDASSGVLSNVFGSGTLPATGNTIEFVEVAGNTVAVDAVTEGDDMGFGKVSLSTRTAPVVTYAGGTELTRQSIERSTVGVLNTSLEALATAAGARKKAVLRTAFNTLVTAREAIASNGGVVVLGATLAAGTAGHWEDSLVEAALRFEAQNLTPDALIVSASVFKKLRSLTVTGERVFTVAERNASGSLDLTGLVGDLAGVPVFLDSGASGDKAAFVNGRAIKAYDSALVSLTDENIVNLSKSFAVYRYGAVAAEIPAGVVPVKLAAS